MRAPGSAGTDSVMTDDSRAVRAAIGRLYDPERQAGGKDFYDVLEKVGVRPLYGRYLREGPRRGDGDQRGTAARAARPADAGVPAAGVPAAAGRRGGRGLQRAVPLLPPALPLLRRRRPLRAQPLLRTRWACRRPRAAARPPKL